MVVTFRDVLVTLRIGDCGGDVLRQQHIIRVMV